MIKNITFFGCFLLIISCNKIKDKTLDNTKISTTSNKVANDKNEDYKSLEGTPFNFVETNYTDGSTSCTRKLFGSDIIKVLSDYNFSPSNGNQFPRTLRVNQGGYLELHAQSGGAIYYGNMKVSANGLFVYFDCYTMSFLDEYHKTQVKAKLTPIQIPNHPFQIEIELEQYGKVVVKDVLTIVVSGD